MRVSDTNGIMLAVTIWTKEYNQNKNVKGKKGIFNVLKNQNKNLKGKNAGGFLWFCSKCAQKREETAVESAAAAARQLLSARAAPIAVNVEEKKEELPGTQVGHQEIFFYDATWREKMRLHPFTVRKQLNLTRFQCLEQTIQKTPLIEQESQLKMVSTFLLTLAQATRTRGLRDDMYLLEALTVFDIHPERRKCNEPMAKGFMRRLLNVRQLGPVAQADILNACAAWFALRGDEFPNNVDFLQSYTQAAHRVDLFPFVEQAWFWLRKLFTTVIVETTFSARNIVQTDLRTSLSEASLRAAVLFKDEIQQFRHEDDTADQQGRKRDFARACLLSEELNEYEKTKNKKQKVLRGAKSEHTLVQRGKKREREGKKQKQKQKQKQKLVDVKAAPERVEPPPSEAAATLLPSVPMQLAPEAAKPRQKQMQDFFKRT
jgi:hypothetical protein